MAIASGHRRASGAIGAEPAAERALAELREAQRIARIGSWSWDPEANGATWSDEMYRIFGRDPADGPAVGEEFVAYVHPDDRERVAAGWRGTFATASNLQLDFRIIRHGREIVMLHALGHRDPARPERYVGTLQDVTELRATERALRSAEDAARRQSETLSALIDNAPIGEAVVAPDGTFLRVNRALCEIVGYSNPELLALTFQDITHPDDLEADLDQVRQVLAGDIDTYQMLKRYIRKDGETVWIKLSVSLVRDGRDAPLYFISQIEDITEARAIEEELVRSEVRLRAIIAAMREGYGLTVAGRITAVNDALCELTGFSREELIGASPPFPFWPPEALDATEELRQQIVANEGGTFELTLMRKDGARFEAEITAQAARNPDGTVLGFVNTFRDISERKRHHAELERLATSDSLTGLANRRVFDEALRAEVARARRHSRPLSVAILDVDHFKRINDAHGHPVGDTVLRELATRLNSLVREGELLARVGGEEFAWLLPDAEGVGAFAAAERARRAVADLPLGAAGTVTLSAGVCDLSEARDVWELYEHADQALYWAKQQGRNQTFRYSAEIADQLAPLRLGARG